MRWKLFAIVALLVVAGAAIALSAGLLQPTSTAATSFLTATAATADVTDEVTATGSVAAALTEDLAFGGQPVTIHPATSSSSSSSNSSSSAAQVAASVTWPVTKLNVAVGDQVTSGEVLATAATTDLESQIADADRSAATASIQLKQATDDLAAASGTRPIRQAKVALYDAESTKARADRSLADLKALRMMATLTAPVAGTVTAVNIEPGADAPSGVAIAIQSAALVVTTNVVESDVTKISVGQKATVTVAAINATLQGTVTSIAPAGSSSGSNGVVEYPVELTLDAPPRGLRPGMSADVSIVTATATGVLAIPSRALDGTLGSYTVRVVNADGSTETRSVTVGIVTSSLAEIQSGLQAGERVVTGTSSSQQTTTNGTGRGGFLGGGGGAGPGGVVVGR
jgi:membrane fusion protein, macrolide-specific efflux system